MLKYLFWIGVVLLALGWMLAPTGDPSDVLVTLPLLALMGIQNTGYIIIAGYAMIGMGLYITRGKIF